MYDITYKLSCERTTAIQISFYEFIHHTTHNSNHDNLTNNVERCRFAAIWCGALPYGAEQTQNSDASGIQLFQIKNTRNQRRTSSIDPPASVSRWASEAGISLVSP